MLSYTGRRNMFGSLCNSTSTTTLALADTLMNVAEKRILAARDWDFLWRQYTKVTVANQQGYNLPAYTRKPQSVYVTVGSYRYAPVEVANREDWDALNDVAVYSDITTHYFVYDGQIQLYPIPSSADNTITFNARRMPRDLVNSDYTTGSITTVATSGVTTTVTGSGVVWSTAMIGRQIRIDQSDSALTLSGDGHWYEIASVPTSTTLTLTRTYGGTAIAAATATYTIAEVSLLPEPHNMLPVYEALKLYYTSTDPNKTQADTYARYLDEGYENMVRDQGSKINVVIDDGYTDYWNPYTNVPVTL